MPSFDNMDRFLDILKLRVRVRLPPPPPPSLAISPCSPLISDDCSSSHDLTTDEDKAATEEEQSYDGKFTDSSDEGGEYEGCSTPRSSESQIPEVQDCPPAPKKRKAELRVNGHELTKKKNKMMAQARTRTKTTAMALETKKMNKKKNHGRSLVFLPDFDPSSMFLLCA